MVYHSYNIPLTESQQKKLVKAHMNKQPTSVRLTAKQLRSGDMGTPILLTAGQVKKLDAAKFANVGLVLKLSAKQIAANGKTGGFLPILPILTALATGALSATAGYAANKGLNAIETAIKKKKEKKVAELTKQIMEDAPIPIGQGLRPLGMGLFPNGVKP